MANSRPPTQRVNQRFLLNTLHTVITGALQMLSLALRFVHLRVARNLRVCVTYQCSVQPRVRAENRDTGRQAQQSAAHSSSRPRHVAARSQPNELAA